MYVARLVYFPTFRLLRMPMEHAIHTWLSPEIHAANLLGQTASQSRTSRTGIRTPGDGSGVLICRLGPMSA